MKKKIWILVITIVVVIISLIEFSTRETREATIIPREQKGSSGEWWLVEVEEIDPNFGEQYQVWIQKDQEKKTPDYVRHSKVLLQYGGFFLSHITHPKVVYVVW